MEKDNNSKGLFFLPGNEQYTVSLPKNWPSVVKQVMLHVISLSHFAMTYVRGWAGQLLAITTVGRFINEVPSDEPTPQTELLEVRWIVEYYNGHRPHAFLNGRTPNEACFPSISDNITPIFEPRKHWPVNSKCASPQAPLKYESGKRFKLHVSYYEGRKYLPIVELKAVA